MDATSSLHHASRALQKIFRDLSPRLPFDASARRRHRMDQLQHICKVHQVPAFDAHRLLPSQHDTLFVANQQIPRLRSEARPTNSLVRRFLPAMREADLAATAAMDLLIANSENVRQRIRNCYSLDAAVINPPVEIQRFAVSTEDDSYYLIVSRLLGYKQIDLAIRAFNANGKRLIIVGDGPYLSNLRSLAGNNIEFAGRLSDDAITERYARCRALILPGEEDFGITPVEAMACGKPVIALARGGALETVQAGETGVLFHQPSVDSLLDAVTRCEAATWNPHAIRTHAQRFSREAFLEKTHNLLEKTLA